MTDPLLTELGELLRRRDPVPAEVIVDAEAAFALSATPPGCVRLEPVVEDPALVRAGARAFQFADKQIRVRVELHGARLIGLVSPVREVDVRWPSGARRVRPDASGLFHVDGVSRGPLRLVIDDIRATPWFRP